MSCPESRGLRATFTKDRLASNVRVAEGGVPFNWSAAVVVDALPGIRIVLCDAARVPIVSP